MSLIPSESASFPDLLGRGLGASKKSKWRVPQVLDQPAPAVPKIEPPSEPTIPAPMVEEKSEPVAAEATQLEPLSADSTTLESLSEELPVPVPAEKSGETASSELSPIEPVSSPAVEDESTAEAVPDAPDAESLPPNGNSELAQLAAILAGSVKIQMNAPPQVQEVGESTEPELTALKPLSDIPASPLAPIPEKIPDSPATVAEKVQPELPPAASPQKDPIIEIPARIPIRPIARSNATAAKAEAGAGTEAANGEATGPVRSVVPPPRPPQAKPRLRPRPNLQPRFETDLGSMAPGDDRQPPLSAPPVSAAPENTESVTYLEYLAPDISTRHEHFQSAKEAAKESPEVRQRQRNKFFWFVGCEIVVLALLVGLVLFGWSHRFGNGSLSPAARLGAIVAAIAVAVLPVIFYGLPKTLPRDGR